MVINLLVKFDVKIKAIALEKFEKSFFQAYNLSFDQNLVNSTFSKPLT